MMKKINSKVCLGMMLAGAGIGFGAGLVHAAPQEAVLEPISVYDRYDDAGMQRLFPAKSSFLGIGTPAGKLEDSATGRMLGYAEDTKVIFRGILRLPENPGSVSKIRSFKLKLKDLTRLLENGPVIENEAKNKNSLYGQLLCIADTLACSGSTHTLKGGARAGGFLNETRWLTRSFGETPLETIGFGVNPIFEVNGSHRRFLAAPADAAGSRDIEFDLIELFGLAEKTATEQMEWIRANSTEYAEGGYRKIRFLLDHQTYAAGGTIELDYEDTAEEGEVPAMGALAHADDSMLVTPALEIVTKTFGFQGETPVKAKDGTLRDRIEDKLSEALRVIKSRENLVKMVTLTCQYDGGDKAKAKNFVKEVEKLVRISRISHHQIKVVGAMTNDRTASVKFDFELEGPAHKIEEAHTDLKAGLEKAF